MSLMEKKTEFFLFFFFFNSLFQVLPPVFSHNTYNLWLQLTNILFTFKGLKLFVQFKLVVSSELELAHQLITSSAGAQLANMMSSI